MNNRTENKLDELLDTMKNRTLPEKDLASTEKFKADFFAIMEKSYCCDFSLNCLWSIYLRNRNF